MTAPLDKVSEQNAIGSDARADHRSNKKSVFPIIGSNPARGWLSKLGLAFGYLGLVAILSTAPFWHQVVAPQESYLAACTDFGGSR